MTDKKTAPETGEDWKQLALSLVTSAVKQSSTGIVQMVHEKIDKTTHAIVKRITIVFLMLLGAAFVLVGAAQYLGMLLGMVAYGYLVLGGVVLLVAALMHFASRE